MMKAHANAVENLVIFAALVLVAHAAGISNALVVCACAVFFWARLVHAVAYTFSVPWVRTGAFVVGFCAHAVIAWQLSTAKEVAALQFIPAETASLRRKHGRYSLTSCQQRDSIQPDIFFQYQKSVV